MAILKCHKLVSMLVATAVVAAPLLLVATAADAASGLFRMKRTWWGGTPVSTASGAPSEPDPYISKDFHPRATGPNKAPPAAAYVGTTSPAPRFTAPSKFIIDYTYYGKCVPGTCAEGYPESKAWYSYWNLKGSFRPDNSRFGGASTPTTLRFPTTDPQSDGLNQGNPLYPTTTPCAGGGAVNGICGYWAHSTLGDHYIGEPITFDDGKYDFSRAGSIMVTPGPNRFGGTMHFFYGANHTYYQLRSGNSPYYSKAYGPQMDVRDPDANTSLGDVQFGGPFNVYQLTSQNAYRETDGNGNDVMIFAPYFYTLAPFTTGMVTGWEPFGDTNTEFTLTGYDNRTPSTNGGFQLSGAISLVRPRLVHVYTVPIDPSEGIQMTWASSSAWQMDFFFLPEPGSTVMMVSGLVVLAGLYRLRKH
jgi:hypothetical protein